MLTRLRVRATFFVLGSAAESHPELIAREADEGHEVAVHNWVHTDVYGVDFPELTGSVRRTCEAITAACGVFTHHQQRRPPQSRTWPVLAQ